MESVNWRTAAHPCFGSVTLDSVILPAKEWRALAPAKPFPETEWTVPEAISRKFNMVLSTSCNDSLPRPEELSAVKFTGKVESVVDGIAYLRYDGQLAGAHKSVHGYVWTSEAKVVAGVGAYDVRAREMLSVTMVFEGTRRNSKYHAPSDTPERFGAVLEWRRGPCPSTTVTLGQRERVRRLLCSKPTDQ